MSSTVFFFLIDVLVLTGLAVMIFYCIRLTKALNNFRQYRQEFNTLVSELSRNIEQASGAVENLKNASFEAGEDLQKVVNNARTLCDELQLMNDMGNALANRLERLSDTGRSALNQKPDFDSGKAPAANGANGANGSNGSAKNGSKPPPAFFIQDRDFEEGADPSENYMTDDFAEDDDDDGADAFESQSERELYAALKKKNAPKGKMF
ncbi:MAG: DUF6468 domain-containing protein [Alphaproteobacteria bacterium]